MSVVVRNLSKHFGRIKAVDDISFEVQPGEIIGLLGPNGAGKTTTVRIITGFLSATAGTVEVGGIDVAERPFEVRRMIGYLPEDNPLYADMDVVDYLGFIARLLDVPRSEISERVKSMVQAFALNDVKHLDIGQLSKGYRQRVGLAQAMIHDPRILILDEPTNGLDPNQILAFRDYLRQIASEKAIMLSTHTLPEVQALCNRVIIIDKGSILADAAISELQKKFQGGHKFFVGLDLPDGFTVEMVQRHLECLESVQVVLPLTQDEGSDTTKGFYIEASRDANLRKQIFQLCFEHGWTLVHLHRGRVQIEDIFHQLTTGQPES
jgi:ABC-2 type transport system ATP-binding protein